MTDVEAADSDVEEDEEGVEKKEDEEYKTCEGWKQNPVPNPTATGSGNGNGTGNGNNEVGGDRDAGTRTVTGTDLNDNSVSVSATSSSEITATKLVRTKSKNAYEVVTDTGEKVSPRLVREGRVPPPGPSRATVVSRPTFRATDKARVKAPPPMAQRQYDDM
eukprot:gene37521-49105_t